MTQPENINDLPTFIRLGLSIYRVYPVPRYRGTDKVMVHRIIVCTDHPWPSLEDAPPFQIDWPVENRYVKFAVLK